jgi:ketosteroid isomerase-like protein
MTEQTTHTERAARNVELVQAGYDAFTRGDLAAVERLFHPDAVWHAQRLGALSGDHKGWPEILRFLGETMQISKGTFRVTVTERYSSPEGVAFMVRSQADRAGLALDDRQMHVFKIDGDRAAEVWQFVGDGRAVDEFWS